MPRQGRSGGGRAPSRPSVAPARPAPQQSRPATTAAYPPARTNQAAPPAQQAQQQQGSAGPGLFGQMASTAAYVVDFPSCVFCTNIEKTEVSQSVPPLGTLSVDSLVADPPNLRPSNSRIMVLRKPITSKILPGALEAVR